MMLYPAMRDLLKKIPSRYQMVNMVAHRAREISAEAEMAGEPLDDKPVSIAIREVAEGKLDEQIEQIQQTQARGPEPLRGGTEHGGQGSGGPGGLRHR